MNRGFWAASLGDNRLSGLISDLWEAIEDCDDPDRLYNLHRRLTLGIVNHAKQREALLRRVSRKVEHSQAGGRRHDRRNPARDAKR